MTTPRAAYTWEDAPSHVTVTAVTPDAARLARQLLPRQRVGPESIYRMSRARFRRFQLAFAEICKHAPARLYSWLVDGTLFTGCCDCGTLLAEKNLKAGRK